MFCFENLSLIPSPKQNKPPLLFMLGKWGGMGLLVAAEVEVKYEIGVVANTQKNTRWEPATGVGVHLQFSYIEAWGKRMAITLKSAYLGSIVSSRSAFLLKEPCIKNPDSVESRWLLLVHNCL